MKKLSPELKQLEKFINDFCSTTGDIVLFCKTDFWNQVVVPKLHNIINENDLTYGEIATYFQSLIPDCRHPGSCLNSVQG